MFSFTHCNNNPVNASDPTGQAYLSETLTSYDWYWSSIMDCWAAYTGYNGQYIYDYDRPAPAGPSPMIPGIGGIKIELSRGWTAYEHPENTNTKTQRHMHIEYKGQKYSQNIDGSPHDGSTGSPPPKVLKELKKKTGWDWEQKEKTWNSRFYMIHISGCNFENGECTCGNMGLSILYDSFSFTPISSPFPSPAPVFSPGLSPAY